MASWQRVARVHDVSATRQRILTEIIIIILVCESWAWLAIIIFSNIWLFFCLFVYSTMFEHRNRIRANEKVPNKKTCCSAKSMDEAVHTVDVNA